MAQTFQSTPSVNANIAGSRQQVNLRDYLNTRIAPFLKKALTESLEAEAQYPLQWLGERLIEYSILYEGNPDNTKIKERFEYKHEAVAAQVTNQPEATPSAPAQITEASASSHEVEAPTTNGIKVEEMLDQDKEVIADVNDSVPPNTTEPPAQEAPQDVEMGNST